MREEMIARLPEIFQRHICTMKRASLDDSTHTSMCDSPMKVINFDKIPNEYARGKGWANVPASNDALYMDAEGDWHFIEFKNGSVNKANIYRKLYDSMIMLLEMEIIPDLQFAREHMNYILVYNSECYGKLQRSESRDENYAYLFRLAGTEERLFEVDKFEKYLFRETHTYSKELFGQRFVAPMEEQEAAQ